MITYPIGLSKQLLIFTDEVIDHFRRFQQTRFWHCEAGGQLFAEIDGDKIQVVEATGPRSTDFRARTRYEPDRVAEQQEIDQRFPFNRHFIGDWHTHPEEIPQPSLLDLSCTRDAVRRSHHDLNAFVLVIVGRPVLPLGMCVSVHDGKSVHILYPISQDVL
jgi:integrative and conjugative element protein (TIGR02256 family)